MHHTGLCINHLFHMLHNEPILMKNQTAEKAFNLYLLQCSHCM